MIPIWQAVLAVFLAGGLGTMVGVFITSACAASKNADRRMGVE